MMPGSGVRENATHSRARRCPDRTQDDSAQAPGKPFLTPDLAWISTFVTIQSGTPPLLCCPGRSASHAGLSRRVGQHTGGPQKITICMHYETGRERTDLEPPPAEQEVPVSLAPIGCPPQDSVLNGRVRLGNSPATLTAAFADWNRSVVSNNRPR